MNFIKKAVKISFAGVISLSILSILFSVYHLLPVHTDKTLGNTDYINPSNSLWCNMVEGINWGRYDKHGFNNLQVIDHPDILMLGSSHMAATNVMQDETLSFLLQQKFGDHKSVYNMGMSSHSLPKVLQYLPKTLALYHPAPETIIIETTSVSFPPESVKQILSGTVEFLPSYDSGILYILQKSPFLRTLYYQFKNGLGKLLMPSQRKILHNESTHNDEKITECCTKSTHYDILFSYISNLKEKYKTRIIIFYHPFETLKTDGSVIFNQDIYLDTFAKKCSENNIDFLDMTEAFYKMYKSEHKLPHGFITGEIGKGHLNADGHRAIAHELYQLLIQKNDKYTAPSNNEWKEN